MLGERQPMAGRRPRPAARRVRPAGPSPGIVIPFDHAAAFEVEGTPGHVIERVVNVGPEGAFVAVAVGYGLEEDRARPLSLAPSIGSILLGAITLGQLPPAALIDGFRLNPRFESLGLARPPSGAPAFAAAAPELASLLPTSQDPLRQLVFQQWKPPGDISFLFSILDSATGRELQDEPTHNLASLGASDGRRPFRLLAEPASFLPRSTIRLQVIEGQPGVKGTLFIVLFGYKLLAGSACPEPLVRSLMQAAGRPPAQPAGPSPDLVPFDYVARLRLTGRSENIVETEVPINVEGAFVATALGYGLAPEDLEVEIEKAAQQAAVAGTTTFDLSALPLSAFPQSALRDGIRLRPAMLRVALTPGGGLATSVRVALADLLFERLTRPEEVSFRYTILDVGTGRELQDRAIHNVAGLGIATGDRPFRKFFRPQVLQPRSMLRERVGRGTLFVVFQGYKVLRPAMAGGAR